MKQIREKIIHSRICLLLAALLVFGIYGLRIMNLDQDLPPWGVGVYQPKDEGFYSILAINEFEYGAINPLNPLVEGESYPMLMQEHGRINILGNLLHMASFHLLGDNYYGLRMPMVAIGFLNLLILGLILLQLRKRYGRGTMLELWGILGMLFLTSMHFYFYLSSRTVEPSTLRMLFAQLTLLIWLCLEKRKNSCFFLMGICVTTSVFLVYITNIFLYLAVGLLLLFLWRTEGTKVFLKSTLWFALGSFLMFAMAWVYYFWIWNTNPIENFFGAIGIFKGVSGYQIAGGGLTAALRTLLKGAIRYFSSSWILYAPTVLTLVLTMVPCLVYKIVKEKESTLFFLLAAPLSFLLQTMVTEDFIWRKFLVIAPYFTYIIFWGALQKVGLYSLCNKWVAHWENRKTSWLNVVFIWVGRLYMPMTVAFTLLMVMFHLKITNDLAKLDFTVIDKFLIMGVGVVPIVIWCGLTLWQRYRKKAASLKMSILLLGGSTLLLNLFMLTIHVWQNPTFEERDMMISLSDDYDLDGKYVIGDYVMGLTLYNDLRYVTDSHLNYAERLIENSDLLMIQYATDSQGMREYFDNTIFSPYSAYTAKQVKTIPGTLQVHGKIKDFALYKAERREVVVKDMKEKNNQTVLSLQEELAKLEKNNSEYSTNELHAMKIKITERLNKIYDPYPARYEDRRGDVVVPIYVDTYGDIYGNIYAPVYGRIFGSVYGNIEAPIYATIFGDVYGDVCQEAVPYVDGEIHKNRIANKIKNEERGKK